MTETVEIVDLEELVNDDECECEAEHSVTTCSIEVTHLYRCCKWRKVVCLNTAVRIRAMAQHYVCTCGKRAVDCWLMIPI